MGGHAPWAATLMGCGPQRPRPEGGASPAREDLLLPPAAGSWHSDWLLGLPLRLRCREFLRDRGCRGRGLGGSDPAVLGCGGLGGGAWG